jgi:hypothetical protein
MSQHACPGLIIMGARTRWQWSGPVPQPGQDVAAPLGIVSDPPVPASQRGPGSAASMRSGASGLATISFGLSWDSASQVLIDGWRCGSMWIRSPTNRLGGGANETAGPFWSGHDHQAWPEFEYMRRWCMPTAGVATVSGAMATGAGRSRRARSRRSGLAVVRCPALQPGCWCCGLPRVRTWPCHRSSR